MIASFVFASITEDVGMSYETCEQDMESAFSNNDDIEEWEDWDGVL